MITTENAESSFISVSMYLENNSKTLRSYGGGSEFKKGKTTDKIKVVFSNNEERYL